MNGSYALNQIVSQRAGCVFPKESNNLRPPSKHFTCDDWAKYVISHIFGHLKRRFEWHTFMRPYMYVSMYFRRLRVLIPRAVFFCWKQITSRPLTQEAHQLQNSRLQSHTTNLRSHERPRPKCNKKFDSFGFKTFVWTVICLWHVFSTIWEKFKALKINSRKKLNNSRKKINNSRKKLKFSAKLRQ